MKNEEVTTDEWDLYQKGIDFKNKIGLYSTVEENNRYYQGDQWNGLPDDGLPKPVFNIIKPVIRYKISTIMQNDTKIVYSSTNEAAETAVEGQSSLKDTADNLTKYAETLWEKLKMDFNNECLLKDGAISGDGFSYFYWDDTKQQIQIERIDNTNIYPSNPNYADIQEQDYIIVSFRRTVDSVRQMAKKYGKSDEDIEDIVSDSDTQYQAGDMAKIELDGDTKCIVLMKFWKDDKTKTVHYRMSTKNFVIADDEDTLLERYPIAMMNWETVKNSFHGVSDVTGLIPNQLYVNKIAAMIMLSTMYTAFPKMVYDSELVDNPDNQIGTAIGVNTGGTGDIKKLIDYITPGSISGDAFNMFDKTITLSKDLMGATEGALGNIDATKTSARAILAIQEQSATPLESQRRRFYNYVEDVALIWADMWRVHSQKGLNISYKDDDGKVVQQTIDSNTFDSLMLDTRIDVGPSSRWSERALQETLDNLLQGKYIPFELYVELMPDESGFPKEKLKQFLEAQEASQVNILSQQNQQLQAQLQQAQGQQGQQYSDEDIDNFLDSLPPEVQQQAAQNPEVLQQIIAQQMGGAQQ